MKVSCTLARACALVKVCALQHGDFAGWQSESLLPHRHHVFHLHGDDSTQFQALRMKKEWIRARKLTG